MMQRERCKYFLNKVFADLSKRPFILRSTPHAYHQMSLFNKSGEEEVGGSGCTMWAQGFSYYGVSSAYLALCIALFSLIFFFKRRLKWMKGVWNGVENKVGKELPFIRSSSLKLPALLEPIWAAYNFRKYGIRVLGEWWRSVDYAPLAHFHLPFHSPAICLFEPELIRNVLGSSDVRVLGKAKVIYDIVFPNLLTDGLLASPVDIWLPHRKLLNRFFTYSSLHGHLKMLNKYGKAFATTFNQKADGKVEEALISSTLYDQLLKAILEVLMGPHNLSKNETRDFVQDFRTLKPLLVHRLLHPLNLIAAVWWLNPTRRLYNATIAKTDAYVLRGIDHTEKLERSEKRGESVGQAENLTCLQHILRSNLSRKEIDGEVATILIAGHETTYGSLCFLLQHLAEHLEILELCQEEVDAAFGSDDTAELSMEGLTNLKYLERCIFESLRLSPAAPLISRQLAGPIELDGFHLDKGTVIVLAPFVVHRNPKIYPNPEQFDPDRFLPDIVKQRHPCAFLPFSFGPRNCIGWKLAMMQMKTMMAYLLRDYHIETTDKFNEMKLDFEITLVPERNFNISLKRRVVNIN